MSDYLGHAVTRLLAPSRTLRPRAAAMYETTPGIPIDASPFAPADEAPATSRSTAEQTAAPPPGLPLRPDIDSARPARTAAPAQWPALNAPRFAIGTAEWRVDDAPSSPESDTVEVPQPPVKTATARGGDVHGGVPSPAEAPVVEAPQPPAIQSAELRAGPVHGGEKASPESSPAEATVEASSPESPPSEDILDVPPLARGPIAARAAERLRLRRGRAAGDALAHAAATPPIEITIGRVEVRAVVGNAAVPPRAPQRPAGHSLEEYLAGRRRGRR
jgi:hypothetical protein